METTEGMREELVDGDVQVCVDAVILFGLLIGSVRMVTLLSKRTREILVK